LPRLIDVTLDPRIQIDLAALEQQLAQVVEGAAVGAEVSARDPAERLAVFLRAWGVGGGVTALLVMLALVGLITQVSLRMIAEGVELLRCMGASDRYLARQFESHALLSSILGGLVGLVLALLTVLGILYTSVAWLADDRAAAVIVDWLLLPVCRPSPLAGHGGRPADSALGPAADPQGLPGQAAQVWVPIVWQSSRRIASPVGDVGRGGDRPLRLFNLALWSWTVIMLVAAIPWFAFPPHLMVAHSRAWMRGVQFLLARIVGLDYEVRGWPAGSLRPAIFAFKHQSAWETLAIHLLLDGAAIALKRELTQIPLFGGPACRHDRIDHGGPRAAPRRESRAALARGRRL
jgi:hypothetical protein